MASLFDNLLPCEAFGGAATLELHDGLTSFVRKCGVLIEAIFGFAIESFEIRDVLGLRFTADFVQVGNQHPKLCSPVADVVLSNDLVALGFDGAAEGVQGRHRLAQVVHQVAVAPVEDQAPQAGDGREELARLGRPRQRREGVLVPALRQPGGSAAAQDHQGN